MLSQPDIMLSTYIWLWIFIFSGITSFSIALWVIFRGGKDVMENSD